MCKIIQSGAGEYECLRHHKTFRSMRAIPTECPTAKKFAKQGAPALPAKYAALSPALGHIVAGTPVMVSGEPNHIYYGTLTGSYLRGTGTAWAGSVAVILLEATNEYAEFWTGPSMSRIYTVMPQ